MGVKGLYSYLRDYRKPVDKSNIRAIGVDALSILYKFRGNMDSVLQFLKPFQKSDISIIFVFDGKAPDEKQEEVEHRREKRNEANQQANSIREFLKQDTVDERTKKILEKKVKELENGAGWHVTRDIRTSCKEMLSKEGIESKKAIGEADDLLISMWRTDEIQAIVSCDMDFLVAGVKKLIVPSYHCEMIQLEKVLEKEDLTFQQFQEAAILCSSNVSPIKAFQWMRYYGSIETLTKKHPELCNFEKEYVERMIEKFNTTKV